MSGDPVHPNSAALLAAMVPGDAVHLDLGTSEEYYRIPYSVVPENQPLVAIAYGTAGADYSDERDAGPMLIPPDVHIEGASGFMVSSSAVWDLTVNHTRPPGSTSTDAAGLPILPGLLRYDEVTATRWSSSRR